MNNVILCVSYMTDIPQFYPKQLIDGVNSRIAKGLFTFKLLNIK